MEQMRRYWKDLEIVDDAQFSHDVRFVVYAAVASLRYFEELSATLGLRMGQLQPEHIIEDFRPLDKANRELRKMTL